MSLCHYLTHNATINCVAVLTAIWIRLNIEWCRDGSVGIVTTVRPGRSGIPIPTMAREFSLLLSEQTWSDSHPASCSFGTRWNGSGVNLTIVPRLGISGVIPRLHPCAFVALTGTSSTFTFTFIITLDTPAYCTESDVISILRLYPNNWTAVWRLYPNNRTAVWRLYPNNWKAVWRLYPNNWTAVWRLYRNNWTAVWRLYPNNRTAVWRLYPNNRRAVWRLYPNNRRAVWRLYRNNWTTVWRLYPNNWTAVWRLYPNNWTAVWSEIARSF